MDNDEEKATPPGDLEPFSLLWPKDAGREGAGGSFELDEAACRDLELDKLFRRIAGDDRRLLELEPILRRISCDAGLIAYRQDIMEDLGRYPGLAACLEDILPALETLRQSKVNKRLSDDKELELYKLTCRLNELEGLVECVEKLESAFGALGGELRSEGLSRLRALAASYGRDPRFRSLAAELPGLIGRLRGIRSVSIGVNLDFNLLPCAATLLSVSEDPYTEKSKNVFSSLFPRSDEGEEGIARLHQVPPKVIHTAQGDVALDPDTFGYAQFPLMVPLFRDLDAIIRKTTLPINRALKKYVSINVSLLGDLRLGAAFYISALRMFTELGKDGLPFCRPRILPAGERRTEIRGGFNVNLAISQSDGAGGEPRAGIVRNDISMGPGGRSFIITGPNRGGKTTYTQAIGLSHILAQLGLSVPGEEAALSPVDGVYTHFPNEEKIDRGTGRLGDEAKRISDIFSAVTERSLVLFNESLSSTNASESLYIAKDIMRVLSSLGARAVFTTHLYELASSVDEINSGLPPGEGILSLVARVAEEGAGPGPKETARTFRIVPGAPEGNSYAKEIAERFGVSLGQLTAKLRERGLSA